MTEKQIQTALINRYSNQYRLMIKNIYFYLWESDLLCIDKNNLVTEIEIKCSKWDYLKDSQKIEKHERMAHAKDFTVIPNKFIYAVDEKFVDQIEIPEYAGLIVLHQKGMEFNPVTVKKAPKLHARHIDPDKWEKLAMTLYYKNQ